MVEKPKATVTIGIDQGKAALIVFKNGKPTLEELCRLAAGMEESTLKGRLRHDLTVSALSVQACLVRPLKVNLIKEKDIEEVIAFQAEPMLPYPLEEGVVDWALISQNEEDSDLVLFAAKKEHLAAHIEECKRLGFDPEVVSAAPVALALFSKKFSDCRRPHFVVDVGYEATTCALVHGGRLLAAQAIPQGTSLLEAAAGGSQELKDVSFDAAGPLSQPFEIYCREVMKLLYALAKQSKGEEIEELLLVGEGALLKGFEEALCEKVEKDAAFIIEDAAFGVDNSRLRVFAVPIGLALSALPKAEMQVNFRQGEYSYPNPWKRLKKPLALYAAAALFLAWGLYFFGQAYLGYQEDRVREQFGDLLAVMGKRYEQFEAEYERKHPHERGSREGESLTLKDLDDDELYLRLETLEKEVNEAPDPIALHPNVPRVSDVLAWLSTHPNVVLGSSGGEPKIQVENFSYTMVQRPEEKKRSSRYQVRVEIEFSSPTPKLAREFHDALIAPNPLVDPKEEVKWSSSRGKYRTSFLLKDRTVYPSQFKSSEES